MEPLSSALLFLVALVMAGVVAAVWDIARRFDTHDVASLNWFLLHMSIGTLGLMAVVLLAAMGRVTPEGVAALLGSVIAYSLGAATGRGANQGAPLAPDGEMKRLTPPTLRHRPKVNPGVHAPTAPPPVPAVPRATTGPAPAGKAPASQGNSERFGPTPQIPM